MALVRPWVSLAAPSTTNIRGNLKGQVYGLAVAPMRSMYDLIRIRKLRGSVQWKPNSTYPEGDFILEGLYSGGETGIPVYLVLFLSSNAEGWEEFGFTDRDMLRHLCVSRVYYMPDPIAKSRSCSCSFALWLSTSQTSAWRSPGWWREVPLRSKCINPSEAIWRYVEQHDDVWLNMLGASDLEPFQDRRLNDARRHTSFLPGLQKRNLTCSNANKESILTEKWRFFPQPRSVYSAPVASYPSKGVVLDHHVARFQLNCFAALSRPKTGSSELLFKSPSYSGREALSLSLNKNYEFQFIPEIREMKIEQYQLQLAYQGYEFSRTPCLLSALPLFGESQTVLARVLNRTDRLLIAKKFMSRRIVARFESFLNSLRWQTGPRVEVRRTTNRSLEANQSHIVCSNGALQALLLLALSHMTVSHAYGTPPSFTHIDMIGDYRVYNRIAVFGIDKWNTCSSKPGHPPLHFVCYGTPKKVEKLRCSFIELSLSTQYPSHCRISQTLIQRQRPPHC
ncbi:uncharacterized protein BDR25DRAFT_394534 [Lindgomyces ingoldianus]|uniref:Uncharacterized protein n=1 Tax=Lindgomyces ingoldianus TaxID=673940 RepID=A0ACB6QQD2_9PLEO|nr:uncharacterized protein BDR25DRAFT_394534 [Lindgomyces ingoldianus]KAF2469203.1 hypothetical protein BDR25DRAFT_394534 [Lindgomyces ingoldianus]